MTDAAAAILHGRCMCGAVRYELSRRPLWIYNCHCGKCRHASDASFVTDAIVPTEGLAFTQGADRMRSWESSPGKHRFFHRAAVRRRAARERGHAAGHAAFAAMTSTSRRKSGDTSAGT